MWAGGGSCGGIHNYRFCSRDALSEGRISFSPFVCTSRATSAFAKVVRAALSPHDCRALRYHNGAHARAVVRRRDVLEGRRPQSRHALFAEVSRRCSFSIVHLPPRPHRPKVSLLRRRFRPAVASSSLHPPQMRFEAPGNLTRMKCGHGDPPCSATCNPTKAFPIVCQRTDCQSTSTSTTT